VSFVKVRFWAFLFSALLILAGIVSLAVQGLNLGIDFTGGTIIHLDLKENYSMDEVRALLARYDQEGASLQRVGQNDKGHELIIKVPHISEKQRADIIGAFRDSFPAMTAEDVLQVDNVGPVIGKELTREAFLALALAAAGMLLYITIRFEFKFACSAVLALLHDVLIIVAFFSFFQWEINSPFVAAILTIIGYSINDTIVIFDRVRENMKRERGRDLREIVDDSISQSLSRCINTSLTTLFVLLSLFVAFSFFVGGINLKVFALALLIGIVSGTYSSIFIAAPFWYSWKEWEKKRSRGYKTA